jgi:hypothetical protein
MDAQNKWLIVLLAWLDELENTGVGTGGAYGSISGDGSEPSAISGRGLICRVIDFT